MTIAQITAILTLLLAFGVSPDTASKISLMLANSHTIPSQTQTVPTFGTLSTPVQQVTQVTSPTPAIIVPMDNSKIEVQVTRGTVLRSADDPKRYPNDPANNIPIGVWSIKVQVLDSNGNPINAEVAMDSPDNLDQQPLTASTDTVTNQNGKDYYHSFSFNPSTVGTHTITLTSGTLTTTTTIDVN